MEKNRLNIVAVEKSAEESKKTASQAKLRDLLKAKFERMWLIDPEQFNPLRNEKERERLKRTMDLIQKHLSVEGKQVADLGCGSGVLTQRLAEKQAHVHAVDIASNALKLVSAKDHSNITTSQDYVPKTLLKDEGYDLVISTELIGYLPPELFRLFFSELSRIVRPDGYVVCSTGIDIYSEDSLQRFADLAETEFQIEQWVCSYHSLYVRLINFLKTPLRFVQAARDRECGEQQDVEEHSRAGRMWKRVNTTFPMTAFWRLIAILVKPVLQKVEQSPKILNGLEKVCRFLWTDSGISHVIFIGKRRPLTESMPENEIPIERKHRKQVWE